MSGRASSMPSPAFNWKASSLRNCGDGVLCAAEPLKSRPGSVAQAAQIRRVGECRAALGREKPQPSGQGSCHEIAVMFGGYLISGPLPTHAWYRTPLYAAGQPPVITPTRAQQSDSPMWCRQL
jgi:hypothetical protein